MTLFSLVSVMKQKYHLISSVISMFITCLLLIFIIFAWYTENEVVSAGGVKGSSKIIDVEPDGVVSGVKYYSIIAIENDKYYYNPELGNETINELEMGSYDALSGNPYQILIEITLNASDLSINASIDRSKIVHDALKDENGIIYQGAVDPTTNKPIVEVTRDQNQLSSIICFYYFEEVGSEEHDSIDMNYVQIDSSNEAKSFVQKSDEEFDKYLNSSITIQDGTGAVDENTNKKTVYILLSYVEEAIEDIYSSNLGNDALNPDDSLEEVDPEHWDDIAYVCDFKLTVV